MVTGSLSWNAVGIPVLVRNKRIWQHWFYRIHDTGAKGGIIVSPLGVQEGARKIAEAENVVSVRLGENSTTKEYVLAFLNKVFIGVTGAIQLSEGVVVVVKNPAEENTP